MVMYVLLACPFSVTSMVAHLSMDALCTMFMCAIYYAYVSVLEYSPKLQTRFFPCTMHKPSGQQMPASAVISCGRCQAGSSCSSWSAA